MHDGVPTELRLYDRLFTEDHPDAGGKDFMAALNPDSVRVAHGFTEPSQRGAAAGSHVQFERHGYFVADVVDHRPEHPVFNRITGLKDTWAR